jgi:aryl-alcohol dehydrogenase-like predicted oxidoreductase
MERVTLGRTGLTVGVMGLGCGGHSRLGLAQNKGEENAVAVVRRAVELGANLIDTAEAYGTEEAVGKALAEGGIPRGSVVLSTKIGPRRQGEQETPAGLKERLDVCLRRLRTDHVDILHLHGVQDADYDHCAAVLVPAMRELRDAGKVRFLGITEAFGPDPRHKMLSRAVQDPADPWDVVMVGFNLLNQSARERVLPHTRARGIGTLCMFAVRRALSSPDALRETVAGLRERGELPAEAADLLGADDPLGFLFQGDTPDAARSQTEAAYRFCRHEPGIDVVLSGTGSVAHLEENATALNRPPLPAAEADRLRRAFAGVDSVSGN